MTPPPGDRTSLSWRITAMLNPEIVALILSIVVVAIGVLVAFVALIPRSSGA